MSHEDEVRQRLLRRIEHDLEREGDPEEQDPPSFVNSLMQAARQRNKELGHMYASEVPDYLDGTLQADRADDLRRHLTECHRCRAMVEQEQSEREELRRYCEQRALEMQQLHTH